VPKTIRVWPFGAPYSKLEELIYDRTDIHTYASRFPHELLGHVPPFALTRSAWANTRPRIRSCGVIVAWICRFYAFFQASSYVPTYARRLSLKHIIMRGLYSRRILLISDSLFSIDSRAPNGVIGYWDKFRTIDDSNIINYSFICASSLKT
jgi:hypothetical protein